METELSDSIVRPKYSSRKAKLDNDSRVYQVMRELGRTCTVTEIHRRLPDIVERTVRRCLLSLKEGGFVIEAGRHNGSILYQTTDTVLNSKPTDALIPLGSAFVSTESFLKVMASMETDPLETSLKTQIFTPEIRELIRRIELSTVVTAVDPGYQQMVEKNQANLIKISAEIQRILVHVQSFIDSAVWFQHYRDRIAEQLREVEKTNPELRKLAWDFVKSQSTV